MIRILSSNEFKRATWKNGLGFTDEIAIFPEGATLQKGDFLWRVSSAQIERASPFSEFPSHDRTLVIVSGDGVKLSHRFEPDADPETVELATFQSYEFPGDIPSHCELIGGTVKDLSVFVRKAEAWAETQIEVIEPDQGFPWVPCGKWNFAFAACGDFQLFDPFEGSRYSLGTGDAARVELSSPLTEDFPIRIEGSGVLVLVGIQGEVC